MQPDIPEEQQEAARTLWREAARSSSQGMIEDCTYWISRLQPRKRGLYPQECFHLWASLGELRFHVWAATLPADEALKLNDTAEKLEAQLAEIVARRAGPSVHPSIIFTLEKGMIPEIDEVQHWIEEAKKRLVEGELAKYWDQIEFDSYLQYPMDKLEYSAALMKSLNQSFSAQMTERLAKLERNFKEILPEAIRQYREAGDPIDANRPVFPSTFWWRRS
jgi:hypothetical protein